MALEIFQESSEGFAKHKIGAVSSDFRATLKSFSVTYNRVCRQANDLRIKHMYFQDKLAFQKESRFNRQLGWMVMVTW